MSLIFFIVANVYLLLILIFFLLIIFLFNVCFLFIICLKLFRLYTNGERHFACFFGCTFNLAIHVSLNTYIYYAQVLFFVLQSHSYLSYMLSRDDLFLNLRAFASYLESMSKLSGTLASSVALLSDLKAL